MTMPSYDPDTVDVAARGMSAAQGSVPVPDPTKLTADAVAQAKVDLRRELAAMRELIDTRINAMEGLLAALGALVQRIPGDQTELQIRMREEVDRQLGNLREADCRLSQEIGTSVGSLRELHEERFTAIQQQFSERDVRGDQEKKASKEALDAALLAQKESVSQQNDANTTAATKSETSFTKQIDQIGTLIATLEKSLTDRITELKERIDRGEGGVVGKGEAISEQRYVIEQRRLSQGSVVALVGVCVVSVSVLASVLIAIFH